MPDSFVVFASAVGAVGRRVMVNAPVREWWRDYPVPSTGASFVFVYRRIRRSSFSGHPRHLSDARSALAGAVRAPFARSTQLHRRSAVGGVFFWRNRR